MENGIKFDSVAKTKISERLSSEAMKLFVDKTKAASDTGSFEMVITTDDIDRMGEMIKVDGWDTSLYMKSPVVLWGHNYSLMPVGITDSLTVQGNKVIAKGRFAPTEMGQTLRGLYDLGMLKASSVGFMVLEQEGNIITKAQLLEWSFVSVPANPYALSLRELDVIQSEEVAGMVVKSIAEKMKTKDTIQKEGGEATDPKTQIEGNPCITTDGKPGTWKQTAEGLVCQINAGEVSMEKKGAVQDELTAEQKMDQKYENLCNVWDVMYALCDVYCDEATPVEDFNKLLTETIGILQTIADGSYVDPDDAAKGVLQKIKDTAKEVREKRNIALKNIVSAKAEDGSTADEAEVSDEDEAEEVDEDIEQTDEAKAVLEGRKILQDVATVMKEATTRLKPLSKILIKS